MLDFQRVNFNPQVGVVFPLVMTDERNESLKNRTDCPSRQCAVTLIVSVRYGLIFLPPPGV